MELKYVVKYVFELLIFFSRYIIFISFTFGLILGWKNMLMIQISTDKNF